MSGRGWLARNEHRLVGVVAVALVLLTTAAVYHAETGPRCDGSGDLVTASGAEPSALTTELAGQLAHTGAVPLVVNQRLRVFAAGDRIWSEPVAAHSAKRYWSCTRLGRTVTGVVADTGPAATVVAQWSDGHLDGIDAKTGEVRWRTTVAPDTSADTSSPLWPVYPESGLFMLALRTSAVVLVARPAQLQGFDAESGRPLWTRTLSGPDCAGPGFSTSETLAGLDVGMVYVFHDTCADVEREINPATGGDVRAFGPDRKGSDHRAAGAWRVVPDACQWHNVGCAVFTWQFDSGDTAGVDILPTFVQASTLPNPPPPYLTDPRGWSTDQVGSPDAAFAFGVFVIHVPGQVGLQGWGSDGRQLWINRRATGYLYGDGRRAYEFSPREVDIVDPGTGDLTRDVTVTQLPALAGVVVQGDLAVLVGPGRTAVILATG